MATASENDDSKTADVDASDVRFDWAEQFGAPVATADDAIPPVPSDADARRQLIRWAVRQMVAAIRRGAWWWAIAVGVAAWLLLCASTGCQNEFRVRVEKLDTPGHVAVGMTDPESARVLATLHELLVGLDGVCIECRRAAGTDAVNTTLEPLGQAQQAARALLPAVEALIGRQAKGELTGAALAAEIDLLRRRAAAQIPDLASVAWDQLIEAQSSPEKQMQLAAAVEQWRTRLAKYAADLAAPTSAQAGFGGFRQAGVYRINPGDAAYDAVLKAKPIGNPLTMVSVRATGDSGFMIVQESPGQMRLYELTNDPVALTRNVSFIIDKVLQAAVKFSSPTP